MACCDPVEMATAATARPLASEELQRVVHLLRDPNTEGMQERHLVALQRVCATGATGLAVRDLPSVCSILEAALSLCAADAAFVEPTCHVIRCAVGLCGGARLTRQARGGVPLHAPPLHGQ